MPIALEGHLPPEWLQEEELLPELIPFVKQGPFGKMLHHPLVVDLCPMHEIESKRCARLNITYRAKLAEVRKLRKAEEYEKLLWLYERAYRLEFLIRYKRHMHPTEYCRTLRSAWADAEWPSRMNPGDLEYLFDVESKTRGLMLDGERKVLKGLPHKVEVYRGVEKGGYGEGLKRGVNGWSWTLSLPVARFFANRCNKKGVVIHGVVNKEAIIFYSDVRKEQEIVASPYSVHVIEVIPV